jgi:hypothetical protein
LRDIRQVVLNIEPKDDGQQVRYNAAIQSLNQVTELRRLRADAAVGRLSGLMWVIIILGALMSMSLVYLFRLEDAKLHRLVVGLLSSFLGLVFLMIVLNDRPFFSGAGIEPDTHRARRMIKRPNPFAPTRELKGESKPDQREVHQALMPPK